MSLSVQESPSSHESGFRRASKKGVAKVQCAGVSIIAFAAVYGGRITRSLLAEVHGAEIVVIAIGRASCTGAFAAQILKCTGVFIVAGFFIEFLLASTGH